MVAAYVQALRGSHRNVRLLLTNSALLGFAIDGGIYSVIFNLYVLRLNFGPEFVGQVNSVANLVFAFGSLAAGWLGMRFGARRICLIRPNPRSPPGCSVLRATGGSTFCGATARRRCWRAR